MPYSRQDLSGHAASGKRLDAMRANPRDWLIGSLESIAAAYGVNIRNVGRRNDRGSVCAKRWWIAAMKKVGEPIPLPSVEAPEGYSGKWELRALKSLNRRPAERSRRPSRPGIPETTCSGGDLSP